MWIPRCGWDGREEKTARSGAGRRGAPTTRRPDRHRAGSGSARTTVVLGGRLVQQHHVLAWNLAAPAETLRDAMEGGLAVEHDVSGVATVVPGGKARIVGLETGHHAKPAPGAQQDRKSTRLNS